MGIPGIWEVCPLNYYAQCTSYHRLDQILCKAMQTRSLTELAFLEGFDGNRRGVRTLTIGVDARYEVLFLIYSCWGLI
jgi:hypothetical protein